MLEYILSFALEMFDLYNGVYTKETHDPVAAATEAKIRATFRISTCLEQKYFFRDSGKKKFYIEKIEEAIQQKIRKIPNKVALQNRIATPSGLIATPFIKLPAKFRLGSIPNQLHALKTESRLTFEEIQEGMNLDVRSIKRHFSGQAKPRDKQLRAYEKFFTQVLSRNVRINTRLLPP